MSVTPVNDVPRVMNPLGNVSMQEDESPRMINLGNTFFDPDVTTNGDSLTYAIVSNSNSGLVTPVVSGSQLALQLLADQNGSAVIEVRATDAAGTSTIDTMTLTVAPVNRCAAFGPSSARCRG